MSTRLFGTILLLCGPACGPPAPSGGGSGGEGCVGEGVVHDSGSPVLHYLRWFDGEGQVTYQERWVHGAEQRAATTFLYARGKLVHQRDDLDGDGRVEVVSDWLRDDRGRLLRKEEIDRLSRRLVSVDQTWEGEAVVRRVQRVDGEVLTDEQMVVDDAGRPVEESVTDGRGDVQSHWTATYDGPPPSMDRHRVGYAGDALVVDADERFDEMGQLVYLRGLVDGYQQALRATFDGTRPLTEVTVFGDIETRRTWRYDDQDRLLSWQEELVASGVVIDTTQTEWSYACP